MKARNLFASLVKDVLKNLDRHEQSGALSLDITTEEAMHTFRSKRGAVRALLFASRRALWVGLGLGLAASLAVAVAGQGRGQPQAPQQTAQPGFGEPVHIYPPNNPYAPPREDGEIHPEHVRGQIWVLTGQPGG